MYVKLCITIIVNCKHVQFSLWLPDMILNLIKNLYWIELNPKAWRAKSQPSPSLCPRLSTKPRPWLAQKPWPIIKPRHRPRPKPKPQPKPKSKFRPKSKSKLKHRPSTRPRCRRTTTTHTSSSHSCSPRARRYPQAPPTMQVMANQQALSAGNGFAQYQHHTQGGTEDGAQWTTEGANG